MKNITVLIDDKLYKATKAEATKRRKSMSALVRELLSSVYSKASRIDDEKIAAFERQEIEAYAKLPQTLDEFDIPESHRVWEEP